MSYRFKIKIKEVLNDTSEMKDLFNEIRNTNLSGLKDEHEQKFAGRFIREKRELLKNEYAYTTYEVHFNLGKQHKWMEVYTEYPTTQLLKEACEGFKAELRSKSKKRKPAPMKVERHSHLGLEYEMTRGVFTESNTILKLKSFLNKEAIIAAEKKPHRFMPDNYVGIELELLCLADRATLKNLFIGLDLHRNVLIKTDGSLRHDNNIPNNFIAHEITILCKEVEIESVIHRVCDALKTVDARVNDSCGMHMHFDARRRDAEIMFNNITRILPVLQGMVPIARRANRYCQPNDSTSLSASQGRGRYFAVNPESYNKYKTIEVRLHSGTVNAIKILNWFYTIKAAVDVSTKIAQTIKTPEAYIEQFNPSDKLADYIKARTIKFSNKEVSTYEDHLDQVAV